jgi:endonuclease/exonuclease/phosphatase (EEP) superfamily protein YafD
VALVVGGAHFVALDATWPLTVANMMLPWIAAGGVASALAAFVGRQGVLILIAIPAAVAASWPVGEEIWPRDPAYGEGAPLRVLTANLYAGNIRQEQTMVSILGAEADVLCLQEVTHAWARTLDEETVFEVYPHQHLEPEDSPFGIAILSKRPLLEVESYELAGLPQLRAVVDVEGTPFELHCIHLMPPLMPELYVTHQRGAQELIAKLAERDEDAGPFAVAGDFNSTPYNALHHRLTESLRDAWDWAGDGFGHSAPANISFIPPMRVDHVYAGGGVRPLDADLLPGNGSDHHPLLVYLAVPR